MALDDHGRDDVAAAASDSPRWERIGALTRWGRYLTGIERAALTRARSAARGPTRALDVGCEGGRFSQELVNAQWSVVCTDVEPAAVELCRRRLPNATVYLVSPESRELPVESQSVGLVVCFEVFAIVHESWFLREVQRALAPGGVLVTIVSNRSSHRRLLWQAKKRRSTGRDHEPPMYSRTYRSWRRELTGLGFDVLRQRGCCWMPFSRESDSRLIGPANAMERGLGLHRLASVSPWICVVAQRKSTL